MTHIYLETLIDAPIERVFDLSRSIDLHKLSTVKTNEEAIAGKIKGLIDLNETVTWRAKHFGVYQKMTVKIVEFKKPEMFADKMLKGAFKSMNHIHRFKMVDGKTMMIDEFSFTSPLGYLGKIFNSLFLKSYLTKFLVERNDIIKSIAESEQWKDLLAT